jgi:hypothetical protein
MNREQLTERVDGRWRSFVQAALSLPADVLSEPGAVGDWSAKDLIAHLAVWEDESLSALQTIAAGRRPPRYARFGGIDAFNDMEWQKFRDLPLAEIQRWSQESHRRLLDYLAEVPEELFATETRFRHRLRLDTYGHYSEHTGHILAWRATLSV